MRQARPSRDGAAGGRGAGETGVTGLTAGDATTGCPDHDHGEVVAGAWRDESEDAFRSHISMIMKSCTGHAGQSFRIMEVAAVGHVMPNPKRFPEP